MSDSERGLRQGALSGFDSVIMAIAGNAPAYSIAATTAVLISVVGLASPAALLYSAIPMLGIAWAFNYLGRADVNAGAAYSWVGRALHPALGFLSGWALVVSATIFMVAGSLPAGQLTLSLFGDGPGQQHRAGHDGRRRLVPGDGRPGHGRRHGDRQGAVDHDRHRGRAAARLRRHRARPPRRRPRPARLLLVVVLGSAASAA